MFIVVGGGPAGFLGAITAKDLDPGRRVLILEKGPRVLRKVKISGGGRCNVTHATFDVRELCTHYPRGHRELIGPFSRFGPAETIAWFAARGVRMRTYPDGCLFPQSDSSQTIIDCLVDAARSAGVEIRTRTEIIGLERGADGQGFTVRTGSGAELACDKVLLATGGKSEKSGAAGLQGPGLAGGYALAAGLGHTIVPPVPSLFTFTITDPLLAGLTGIVAPDVRVSPVGLEPDVPPQGGPLLITHWGLSGPAVLQLSAWGARAFHAARYRFTLAVDWCPALARSDLESALLAWTTDAPRRHVLAGGPVDLSRRLWERLVARARIPEERRWADLGRKERLALADVLKRTHLPVTGQSTFKEEFVTAGGVALREVQFSRMESRLVPGLHFAGEVLDIDGVTGGFNFQACWTTGYLAGQAMAGQATA